MGVANEILLGGHDERLDELKDAIRARENALAQALRRSLKAGDTVQFNEKVRPQYLIGALATVTRILPKNVEVEMIEDAGRYEAGLPVKTSPNLIDLVETAIDPFAKAGGQPLVERPI